MFVVIRVKARQNNTTLVLLLQYIKLHFVSTGVNFAFVFIERIMFCKIVLLQLHFSLMIRVEVPTVKNTGPICTKNEESNANRRTCHETCK